MWLPGKAFDLFRISHDTVSDLRTDVSTLRTENAALKDQLARTQILSDWLRIQVNTLQLERTGLIEKAYGIKLPAPEIVRATSLPVEPAMQDFSFDDMGEQLAKRFGHPSYEPKN